MTNPQFNAAIYLAGAVLLAILIPSLTASQVYVGTFDSAIFAGIVATLTIYMMMAVTAAFIGLMSSVGERNSVSVGGNSFMQGFGLFTLFFTLVPALAGPGLVWLYVLPYDINGKSDRSRLFSLDESELEALDL